jgi:hypothetical protein
VFDWVEKERLSPNKPGDLKASFKSPGLFGDNRSFSTQL